MAKTKALISFAVTAKLICVFVFAYAKRWFSHDAAHIILRRCDNNKGAGQSACLNSLMRAVLVPVYMYIKVLARLT